MSKKDKKIKEIKKQYRITNFQFTSTRSLHFYFNNSWFALPPCWCTKQKKICSHSLHKNGSLLPEEENLIVPNHQHGRHDVTYKPSMVTNEELVFQYSVKYDHTTSFPGSSLFLPGNEVEDHGHVFFYYTQKNTVAIARTRSFLDALFVRLSTSYFVPNLKYVWNLLKFNFDKAHSPFKDQKSAFGKIEGHTQYFLIHTKHFLPAAFQCEFSLCLYH